MVASIDLQILLRLRPYPMRSSWAATYPTRAASRLMHSKPNYHLLDCACCREELRCWLEATAAGLPCNLPEQLQHLTHAASSSSSAPGGKEQGPVTRRDMLALLPARTVSKVSRTNTWQCTETAWTAERMQEGQSNVSCVCLN